MSRPFTPVFDDIAARSDLNWTEKALYSRILRYRGIDASQEQLAEALGISVDTVQRGVTKLQRLGLLDADRNLGKKRRNVYRVRNRAAAGCGTTTDSVQPQSAVAERRKLRHHNTATCGSHIERQALETGGETAAARASAREEAAAAVSQPVKGAEVTDIDAVRDRREIDRLAGEFADRGISGVKAKDWSGEFSAAICETAVARFDEIKRTKGVKTTPERLMRHLLVAAKNGDISTTPSAPKPDDDRKHFGRRPDIIAETGGDDF